MTNTNFASCLLATIALLGSWVTSAQSSHAAEELVEFNSEAGRFSILLPGKPHHQVTEVGSDKEKQHQFMAGSEEGAYIVSYQDNDNLEGRDDKGMIEALESGRDRLIQVFHGKLLESKVTKLDKKHPGLDFRVTIPAAKGEANCRFYMVGTRLYQIIAIGKPEFANSDQAKEVIASFTLLEK